jgi:peptidase M23-like protein
MTLSLLATLALLAPNTPTATTFTAPALSPNPLAATPLPPTQAQPGTAWPRTAPPAQPGAISPLPPAPAQPGAVWPLSPRPEVVRGFEPPPKPWLPGHRGLDLRGSPGQLVRSATSGTVTYAGPLAGRGVIVITDGPRRTTYEPVMPTVRAGTHVTPGTPLGRLSAAASHCAPATCLHWGLLQATTYLNPLSLLPHRPVRLLPNTPHSAPPTNSPTSGTPPTPNSAPIDPALTSTDSTPALTSTDSTPGLTSTDSTPQSPRRAPRPDATQPATQSRSPQPAPQPPSPQGDELQAPSSPRGGLASTLVVGLAATATLVGSVLIRRH